MHAAVEQETYIHVYRLRDHDGSDPESSKYMARGLVRVAQERWIKERSEIKE